MDLVAAVVADQQSLELVEPGEGALDDPAGVAESGAVLAVLAGDLRCDPSLTQFAAIGVGVVAAVGEQALGSSPRPADLAAYGGDGVDKRHQLGDVVAVAARDRPRERDPGRVDQQVMLGAVSASINRARARRGAPFFACT